MEQRLVRVLVGLCVVCLLVAGALHGFAWVRSLGDGVVRASVPAIAQEQPTNPNCCLIPANRGLHKERPW